MTVRPNWARYGECPACDAASGERCRDIGQWRYHARIVRSVERPHRRRRIDRTRDAAVSATSRGVARHTQTTRPMIPRLGDEDT